MDKDLKALEEFNNYKKIINKWYKGKRKVLNINTSPYNELNIFIELIINVIKEKKKVLYISQNEDINKDLLNKVKININQDIKYSFNKEDTKNNITFFSYNNALDIKGFYDLCIIDDISNFSLVSQNVLREYIEYLYLYCKKVIIYSIEKNISVGEVLKVSNLNRNKPFVEPRILNTRVNLEEDIPYNLYDYLTWFKENKRKVVIIVPRDKSLDLIYNYYENILGIKDVKIIKFLKEDKNKDLEKLYKEKNKSIFLITNEIRSFSKTKGYKGELDIILLFAENIYYNYKKMVYLSSEVGKNIDRNKRGELILVSKYLSEDMDKAKEITRNYNKELWEIGLLKK
ncbi:hypothetical protein [Clostridium sp.]|uniref:hypothetical protein n=1 Tax=Clostridium sp. TaxID=1506 RepID=UPI00260FE3E5|nr:hypothetical protein [Clostridium sp.]